MYVKHVSVLFSAKQNANAGLVDQSIAGIGEPNPYSEIPDDVLTNLEVSSREKLVDLLVGRQYIAQRSYRPVILQTGLEPSGQSIGKACPRLEIPPLFGSRTAQSSPYRRIEIKLESAHGFLQNRPDFQSGGVFIVELTWKSHLRANTDIQR